MDINKNLDADELSGKVSALTNWENPPKLADLKADLTSAWPTHTSKTAEIAEWLKHLNIQKHPIENIPEGRSKITPSLIKKLGHRRHAALTEPFLSTEDIFNIRPVTWEDRESAKQNELVLNYQFNTKLDKTKFIDEYIRTAVDEGTVIVKVGWHFEEEDYVAKVPDVEYVVNPELAPLHEELAKMKQESPSQYATDVPEELKTAHEMTITQGYPIEVIVKGHKEETRTRTTYNCPTLEVCHYADVIIDPTCFGDIRKASFVIYKYESSISDLKKNSRYKNVDQINIDALSNTTDSIYSNNSAFNFKDTARKKVIVYEYWGYWDINNDGKVEAFVASWVGDTLIQLEENPYPDKKIPFVIAQYHPVRKSNYGEPDAALLIDNQKILGAVTRGMIDILARSANGQVGTAKGILDEVNTLKFDKGLNYQFNPSIGDPRQGIFMHTYPEIPSSAQYMAELQISEAESLTGIKSYSQGISGQSLGDVAAGVRGALDAESKRELSILRRLASGIVEIGRKIISMNSEFLNDEEVIRVTNEQFVTIRRDDLAGNFDLRLSISTAEEDNNKAEQLAMLLQTIGPNADPELFKIMMGDIARLRKMPDFAHKIEHYQPVPDPIAQKKAELEITLLEAQIAKENAMAANHQSRAILHEAQAGTERSETDLKNLNFVEQESGVKQERSKELVAEQARSQLNTKIVEHDLNTEALKNNLVAEYVKKMNGLSK